VKDAQPRLFNPAANQLYHAQAQQQIPRRSARLFLELLKDGELPSWVPQVADLALIKAAAL
jgi:hypothetical protein